MQDVIDSSHQKRELCYLAFSNVVNKNYNINLSEVLLTLETNEYINTNDFKTLKGNLQQTFEQLFFELPKKKLINMYDMAAGRCCNEYADYDKVFKGSVDSVYTFGGNLLMDERPPLQFSDYIQRYKMMQTWYFDANTHQLVSKLNAVAPVKEVLDDNGNFLYTQPLFYLCFGNQPKEVSKN